MNKQTLFVAVALVISALAVASTRSVSAQEASTQGAPLTRPVTSPKQIPTYTIRGSVQIRLPKSWNYPNFKLVPFSKALITVQNASGSATISVKPNEDGNFSLVLPRGRYTATIRPFDPGYVVFPNPIRVFNATEHTPEIVFTGKTATSSATVLE